MWQSKSLCTKHKAKETGGVIGGWAGGTAGAAAAGAFVAFVGITSAPIVMVVVGAAALGGGIFGGGAGKDFATRVYDLSPIDELLEQFENSVDEQAQDRVSEYILNSRFNNFSVGQSIKGF